MYAAVEKKWRFKKMKCYRQKIDAGYDKVYRRSRGGAGGEERWMKGDGTVGWGGVKQGWIGL